MRVFILFITGVFLLYSCNGQQSIETSNQPDEVKNIILMIGDGMGVSQIYAGMTANQGHLNIERITNIGFSKTHSANDYITDSGASGTAMASGIKTYNKAIGVNIDTIPVKSILEYAEDHGKTTGLIATSSITHATPASFIAHQSYRHDYEDIAADFLKTDIEVFIGGGLKNFIKRKDKQDLTEKLKENGYEVILRMEDLKKSKASKIAGLLYDNHPPKYSKGRNDMLQVSSLKRLRF